MVSVMKSEVVKRAAKRLLGQRAYYSGGTWRRGSAYLRVGKSRGWRRGSHRVYTFSVRKKSPYRAEVNVHNHYRTSEPDHEHRYGYDKLEQQGGAENKYRRVVRRAPQQRSRVPVRDVEPRRMLFWK
jgi:hypothetical protein